MTSSCSRTLVGESNDEAQPPTTFSGCTARGDKFGAPLWSKAVVAASSVCGLHWPSRGVPSQLEGLCLAAFLDMILVVLWPWALSGAVYRIVLKVIQWCLNLQSDSLHRCHCFFSLFFFFRFFFFFFLKFIFSYYFFFPFLFIFPNHTKTYDNLKIQFWCKTCICKSRKRALLVERSPPRRREEEGLAFHVHSQSAQTMHGLRTQMCEFTH